MFSKDAVVLQGAIEPLLLERLSQDPMHGSGVANRIETGQPAIGWLRLSDAVSRAVTTGAPVATRGHR